MSEFLKIVNTDNEIYLTHWILLNSDDEKGFPKFETDQLLINDYNLKHFEEMLVNNNFELISNQHFTYELDENTNEVLFGIKERYYASKEKNMIFKFQHYPQILKPKEIPHKISYACTFDGKKQYEELFTLTQEKYRYIKYKEPIQATPRFNTICFSQASGYYLEEMKLRELDIKPEYYNNTLNIEKLKQVLETDKSGLILLSGVPGSGKSSLIKYLSKSVNKLFCYIPMALIDMFNDPSFQEFIRTTLKDAILIIEDCELLLMNRDNNKSSSISTILNMSDGLLGDSLRTKIIATINTNDKLDSALLRKGRTIFSHNFTNLSVENANIVAKYNDIDVEFTSPTPLCDIFNYDSEETIIENNKTTKVGGFHN